MQINMKCKEFIVHACKCKRVFIFTKSKLPLRPSTPFSSSPPLASSTKKRGLHQFSQINRLVVEAVEENMGEKDRTMAEESEPGIWNRNDPRNL
jgi:hypothetical protein